MVRYEACVAFEGDGTGTPVCIACGWLDREHVAFESRRADVRELPTQSPAPARLAS